MGIDVSVVLPAYNAEPWIGQAIASVLLETDVTVEVIVVDDASEDRTANVVEDISRADDRVHLIRKPANEGPGPARNVGLTAASGTWVAFLDADDWWSVGRARAMVELGREADVVVDDVYIVHDGGDSPWASMFDLHGWAPERGHRMMLEEFLSRDWILHPMVRRDLIERHGLRFAEDLRHGEDFLFCVETFVRGARWVVDPVPRYFYRIREGSITRSGDFTGDNVVATLRAQAEVHRASSEDSIDAMLDRTRRVRAGEAWSTLRDHVRGRRWGPAAREAVDAIRYWPDFARIMKVSWRTRRAARSA